MAQLVIGGDVAGGQLVALAVARAARARGDDVLVLAPFRGRFTELVEAGGMRVELVDVSRTFRLGGAVGLARLLRRERIDVLHTHTAVAANVLSRLAGRIAGVPVVSHLHIENHFRSQPVARAVLRSLDNATARLAARVVAVSQDTRAALVRQGYPPGRVEVVPNGIAVPPPREPTGRLREELGLPPGAPLVGEIARLCDVKGQRELIRALAKLPDVHAVLVGDDLERNGAYRELLVREARTAGVGDRVVLTGYRPDVPEILDELDVVALPSWIEGLPLVLLEALAHGRPVVATPVGGTPELVVDSETGLLVPPRDPEALAAALRRLLDDPVLAARLGEAGRERVRDRFSVEAMTARLLALYDEVAR